MKGVRGGGKDGEAGREKAKTLLINT
jgi:hypothetical protein